MSASDAPPHQYVIEFTASERWLHARSFPPAVPFVTRDFIITIDSVLPDAGTGARTVFLRQGDPRYAKGAGRLVIPATAAPQRAVVPPMADDRPQLGRTPKDLRISFSYTLVTVRRPWLTYNLLGTKGWNLGNLYTKGKLSNGTKAGQTNAVWPLLPTSFVVVKDVVISASWSKADLDLIKSKTSGGGGFAIGPFSIGGSYTSSHSKETSERAVSSRSRRTRSRP